jgi:hypothetical protein
MAFHTVQRPGLSGATIVSSCPSPPFRTGSRRRGKKGEARIEGDYLDWALRDFSGYIAADELYEGPFCVLSIVDNRCFKRILYEVLDHDPTHDDIRQFFKPFKMILERRGLRLFGITTDASPLYPKPISEVFGDVAHQICEFHVISELTKAVLRAVAKVRQVIRAQIPKVPRGRPSAGAVARRAREKDRRPLRTPLPLCPTSLDDGPDKTASTDQPWAKGAAHALRDHGRGLPSF